MLFSGKKQILTLIIALQLIACGSGSESSSVASNQPNQNNSSNNAYFETPLVKTYAHQSSPFEGSLVSCVYSNQLTDSCTLAVLPLIAQTTETPTVNDIMNRVVVSHDWMGVRFQEFLTEFDHHDDFKNLLRATTAIVIASDIRPSFYWAATGAIYLDPENLWLSQEERETIDTAPDYRSSFGEQLQFSMPWRYVKNNSYAYLSYPRNQSQSRTINDIVYRLSALLYHELAHANDYFPSDSWLSFNSTIRVLDAALASPTQSKLFSTIHPLSSPLLSSLAQVSFAGESATDEQINYLPEDISYAFSNDVASDYYSYSDHREDYAMLFEELMMAHRFQVYRDVAVTNKPVGDDISAEDYIIDWGQRTRISQDNLIERVVYATSTILPTFDAAKAIRALPATKQLRAGDNWQESINLSSTQNSAAKRFNQQEPTIQQPIRFSRYFHKPLPNTNN